jgi:2-phospho-L-lactate guanylyltransferase
MNTVVLVTVKEPERAKLRMAPLLSTEERSLIAWAMFEDAVQALQPLSNSHEVALVTNSRRAADKAQQLGWRVLWETEQISESASVDQASAKLAAESVEAVLRIPADIPLIRSEDIRLILAESGPPRSAVLVPSWDRMGTNAVLRVPPTLFPSRFGHNSLVLHTQEARRAQASLKVLENERLALDLDDASDLVRFLERRSETQTFRLLQQLQLNERLYASTSGKP